MSIDFERALMLMNLIKEVANTAPMAQAVAGLAQAELNDIVEEAKAEAAKIADKRREEEAKREADTQAKLRAEGKIAELPNEEGQDLTDDEAGPEDGDDEEEEPRRA